MQDSLIPLSSRADLLAVWLGSAHSLATAPTMAIWLDIPDPAPVAPSSGLFQALQTGDDEDAGVVQFSFGESPPPAAKFG